MDRRDRRDTGEGRATQRPILRAQNLTKTYYMAEVVFACRNVYLDVFRGDLVLITGPSGSGKSTLLGLLAGLDRPIYGEVIFDGHRYGDMDENALARLRRHRIGYVYQFFNLIPHLSALDNVALPMVFAGKPEGEAAARARELLDMVGLGMRMGHLPSQLSGGEQQRVAIARALANDPEVILADEPTGNLDTKNAAEVAAMLRRANRELGRTVVVVSHDPAIREFASRVVHMRDGRIEQIEGEDYVPYEKLRTGAAPPG